MAAASVATPVGSSEYGGRLSVLALGARALRVLVVAGLLAGLLSGLPATAQQGPTPVVVDLGALGGGFGEATGINELGQVVGSSATGDYVGEGEDRQEVSHAFSWTRSGGMVDLGTLGGDWSHAVAASNFGQVVGCSTMEPGGYYEAERHALEWPNFHGAIPGATASGMT